MNITLGKKVHHPPVTGIGTGNGHFLCGDYRGYEPASGFKTPWAVERPVDCLNCLSIIKQINTEQMADSGITFRIIASTKDGLPIPSFYLSSITSPGITTKEDAIRVAHVILGDENRRECTVKAIQLNK